MSDVARSTSALLRPALTSSRNNSFGFIASAFASSSRLRIASVSVAADCAACGFEPDEGKMRARLLARGFQALPGLREQRRGGDIVERGEFGERLHDLEGARQSEPRRLIGLDPGDVPSRRT